jgi:hypothetical protein
VWWGGAPVENYERTMGLFNSEYGMQSLTTMSSMNQFLNAEDLLSVDTPTMHYHNKMGRG